MRTHALVASTAAALFLGACVSQYKPPDVSLAQATLHISHSQIEHLTNVGWHLCSDANCTKTPVVLGAFSALYASEKDVQLEAGKTQYLQVSVSTPFVRPWNYPVTYPPERENCSINLLILTCRMTCKQVVALQPKSGVKYSARMEGNGEKCEVKVTEMTDIGGTPSPTGDRLEQVKSVAIGVKPGTSAPDDAVRTAGLLSRPPNALSLDATALADKTWTYPHPLDFATYGNVELRFGSSGLSANSKRGRSTGSYDVKDDQVCIWLEVSGTTCYFLVLEGGQTGLFFSKSRTRSGVVIR